MKVELPGESKSFADIKAGECFAFTREQVTSVCMKVEWLSSASVAVLWSASDDWTVPHLIAPTELAGSILHSLPSAVFVASSDAKDVRADRTRHEYAPGFLIKTPTGQSLIAVKGLQRVLGASDGDLIELACHPGYVDQALRSSYRREREVELRTLCDKRVPQLLDELGFALLDSQLRTQIGPETTSPRARKVGGGMSQR